MILRAPWRPGPAAGEGGPVLVSLTAFEARRRAELPGIYRSALGLRRSWPRIEGAVGLWLWAEPLGRRVGSVSVWRGEEELRRFVGWAPHVEIMRHYRDRGTLDSRSWWSDGQEREALWREAREALGSE